MLHKTKTLTTIARQKKAKEKALKWTSQTGKEPFKNHSEKSRAYKMLKRTTIPLRRRVLVEEGPAISSKKQHLENTDMWHICKAGSFSYSESLWTLPLRELHSTNETLAWRDPGGSWACLPPVYDYEWNHTATCCHVYRTCPKKQLRKKRNPTKCWEDEVS